VSLPGPLQRRFEAVVFDWDGTAVPDRRADATRVRELVEACCAEGLDLVVVSGTHVDNIDGQLGARPHGPGTLHLALNRGSEVYAADTAGVHLVQRRTATAEEDQALDRAAAIAIDRLRRRGLPVRLVSTRLNRRKLDLIDEPQWADPPKAAIGALLKAVDARLAARGIDGLPEVVMIAEEAAEEAGLPRARVTSDVKHVEIGLTDKSDSARWILGELWRSGVGPSQILICGDELGSLGSVAGSDALLLTPRATAVSVGVEPEGMPAGVLRLPGGPPRFAEILADQLARRRRRDPPDVADEPGWALTVSTIEPLRERATEALLTLGDGRTGTRGSVAIAVPESAPGVLVASVYHGHGPETELLAAPLWNLVAAEAAPRDATRRLDLHAGTLWQTATTEDGTLEATAFASLAQPATMALRTSAPAGLLSIEQGLCDATTQQPVAGPICVSDDGGSTAAAVVEERVAEADGGVRLQRLAGYDWQSRGGASTGRADQRARSAARNGYERLLRDHRRAWAARWDVCDARIDGDDELQLGVRLAIYHLIASTPSDGEGPVGARGLTGPAYRGHVFWDTEAYMLPFHAATHPACARAMLEYRVARLPAALEEAQARGRAGACFPWESADDGREVTPTTAALPSGEVVQIRTGDLEDHIAADIAWAAASYAAWTGDTTFARGPGRELLVQTARYWASRIVIEGGRAHIHGVIGPDEYHEAVHDNAYTNVMARWNLRAAARIVDGCTNAQAREPAHWRNLADILVDGYDPDSGIYEQFLGFFDLEPLIIADLAQRRPVAAPLLLGADRVARSQVIKQADVLMLHYLVPDEVAAGSLVPNLEYYEPRTAHGSTLSPGVHAALLARAGRPDEALEWLRLTARIDLDDVSATTAGGVHLAAMGTVWRALSWGFAGLSPGADELVIDPRPLPASWRSLDVGVRYRGTPVRVRLDREGIAVAPAAPIGVLLAPTGHRERVSRAGTHLPVPEAEG
jgi:trehalose/maltose hydrolase-like predicted phosphorylase